MTSSAGFFTPPRSRHESAPPRLGFAFDRLAFRAAGLLTISLSLPLLLLATAADPAESPWEAVAKESTGGFIMSLARDAESNIWVGTEDKGIVCIPAVENPLLPGGQQFTRKDAAPDNGYALCFDSKNRLWAGSLNHGVSVYNGDKWRCYDVLDGPTGERIFAIATCPTDGDIWIATSAGLTRYSRKNDSWSYHTRAEGLPEDQANAIAFNPKGDIFVGTQCHGIAMAKATDDYKKWTVATGPMALPTTPTGRGLPTPLINGMCVSKTGTVYAATSAGLTWSKDAGKTWQYIRGKDYADKVKGRWGGPPRGWRPAAKQVMDTLLPEDYVTCVCESNDGLIWLGFRQQGYVALDPKTFRVIFSGTKKSDGLPDDYVTCILPMPDFRPYIGTYGGGVARAKKPMKAAGAKAEAKAAMKAEEKAAALPAPAKAPTVAELTEVLIQMKKATRGDPAKARIIPLEDDWKTRGNWIDRYGRFGGVLCAMAGGGADYSCGYRGDLFKPQGWLGPHHPEPGDQLRHWVHWINTQDTRSLQNSFDGGRKQAEWDDHGEVYPMGLNGPHVFGTVRVPPGDYVLGLYFFNKDGHDGPNRFRDFLVEVRPTPAMTDDLFLQYLDNTQRRAHAVFEQSPRGARARVRDFWGGVYKRYYLHLPPTARREHTYFTVKVDRNHSFNTILSAIFLDPVGQLCGNAGPIRQPAPPRKSKFADLPGVASREPRVEAALRIMDGLLCLRDSNPEWQTDHRRKALILASRVLLRADAKGKSPVEHLEMAVLIVDLRRDLAECLHDLQLYNNRDALAPISELYGSYVWEGKTKSGPLFKWDREEHKRFLEKRRNQKFPVSFK